MGFTWLLSLPGVRLKEDTFALYGIDWWRRPYALPGPTSCDLELMHIHCNC